MGHKYGTAFEMVGSKTKKKVFDLVKAGFVYSWLAITNFKTLSHQNSTKKDIKKTSV